MLTALKTEGLKQLVAEYGFTGIFAGIRRDEEGTRAKERVFSPRSGNAEWDVRDQPPEFWDQFKTDFAPGTHLRIHPLLHWTELDVWRYVQRENIPLVDLYFARDGKRYRSLGCAPCTTPIDSDAATVGKIIAELERTTISERSGRAQDKEVRGCLRATPAWRIHGDDRIFRPQTGGQAHRRTAAEDRHRRPCGPWQVDLGGPHDP